MANVPDSASKAWPLLPEEDAIDDPDEEDDEIDDLLPADLWFGHRLGSVVRPLATTGAFVASVALVVVSIPHPRER
jgi:hypothetical protein